MESQFPLEITLNDRNVEFTCTLSPWGYTHQIHVNVDGRDIIFEPDENRKYRAILKDQDVGLINNQEKEIIAQITRTLDSLHD
jgi:hypothetical protein